MFFPLAIIVIGVILLLENIGVITGNVWEWVWPALIIILGASMIWRRRKRFAPDSSSQNKTKQEPSQVNQIPEDQVEDGEFEEKN